MPNAHRTAASAPALRQRHSALAHCARAANTAANTSCFCVHRWRTPGQLSPPLLGSPSLRLADTQTTLRPSHSCSTRPAICRPRLLDVPSSIRFERAASLSKPFSLGRRGGHLLFPARPSATPMTTTTTPRLRISGPMTLRGSRPPESARTVSALKPLRFGPPPPAVRGTSWSRLGPDAAPLFPSALKLVPLGPF